MIAEANLPDQKTIGLNPHRHPAVKTLAIFDLSSQPSVKREQIDSLHELGFVERRENTVFLGPPVPAKTHLAISLAVTAAESGRRGLLRHP